MLSSDGDPVTGAHVFIVGSNSDRLRLVEGSREQLEEGGIGRLSGAPYVNQRRALSNQKGRFVINDVPVGTYAVEIRVPGHAKSIKRTVTITPSSLAKQLRFIVDVGEKLVCRVVDEHGRSIDALICLARIDKLDSVQQVGSVLGGRSYRFSGLLPGKYLIVASAKSSDWNIGSMIVDVPGPKRVVLRVAKAGAIRGRYVNGEGKGVEGIVVLSRRSDLRFGKSWTLRGKTDSKGRFFIKVSRSVLYDLRVGPARKLPAALLKHGFASHPDPATAVVKRNLQASDREIVFSK